MQETEPGSNRLLIRYANRKLYDTVLCRYITMDDVLDLVLENIPFVVLGKAYDKDHTNQVLSRMLWNMSIKGAPLDQGTLRQMIKTLALSHNFTPLTPPQKRRKKDPYEHRQQSHLGGSPGLRPRD